MKNIKYNRKTKARLAIIDFFSRNSGHYTAKDVYDKIRANYSSIGLATIYRNLEELYKQNVIDQLSYPGRPLLYELRGNNHSHFFCDNCQTVYDIDLNSHNSEINKYGHGHFIKRVDIEYSGICKDCLTNMF